jgi:2'-5' RNA ligase
MRLFIALDLPETIESALMEVREALDPDGGHARWVGRGSMHLTLKFLGEVSENRVPEIRRVLERIGCGPVEARISGIGFFPNDRAGRILWAGIQSERLPALAAEVEEAMAGLGFPPESRAFRPHLTLARASRKGTMGSRWVEAAKTPNEPEFGSFTARSFFLYRSRLEKRGAVHEKLAEFVFAGK